MPHPWPNLIKKIRKKLKVLQRWFQEHYDWLFQNFQPIRMLWTSVARKIRPFNLDFLVVAFQYHSAQETFGRPSPEPKASRQKRRTTSAASADARFTTKRSICTNSDSEIGFWCRKRFKGLQFYRSKHRKKTLGSARPDLKSLVDTFTYLQKYPNYLAAFWVAFKKVYLKVKLALGKMANHHINHIEKNVPIAFILPIRLCWESRDGGH